MANTTWNPSDKSANITLSGGNLIATSTAIANAGVRTIDRQIAGKFYWEATCNTIVGGASGVGFVSPGWSLGNPVSSTLSGPGNCGITRSGVIVADGVSTGLNIGAVTNGAVVCMAVDAGARLAWFRLGAAGNWNANAANNPATGVGGVAFTGLGVGIPVHPIASFAATSDQITANFGDTAFTGAVPAGFTSGFTAGVTTSTNALATQVAAEHWLATNPDAQVTQVALEHWATVTGTGVQALVTQVALEQWASVASVSATPPQARVMVMA